MYHLEQHIYDIDCVFLQKFHLKVSCVIVVNMPCGKMGSNNKDVLNGMVEASIWKRWQ